MTRTNNYDMNRTKSTEDTMISTSSLTPRAGILCTDMDAWHKSDPVQAPVI